MTPALWWTMSLSHLMRSVATGPQAALCDSLLCCAGLCVESLAKVWFQGVRQARASWGSSASRAVAEPWFRILGWCHSTSGCCLQQVKPGSNYVSCLPLERSESIEVFLNHREASNWFVQTPKMRRGTLSSYSRHCSTICSIGRNNFLNNLTQVKRYQMKFQISMCCWILSHIRSDGF